MVCYRSRDLVKKNPEFHLPTQFCYPNTPLSARQFLRVIVIDLLIFFFFFSKLFWYFCFVLFFFDYWPLWFLLVAIMISEDELLI